MAVIIDGKSVSRKIKEQIKKEVYGLNQKNKQVGLAGFNYYYG